MSKLFEPYDSPRSGARPLTLAVGLRRTWGVANLIASFAIAIAITVNITDRVLQGIFDPSHYFQYFTIQTSLINIVVLLIGGMFGVMRLTDPRWYSVLRASIVAYAVVVGVVYNVLLAGFPSSDGYIESSPFPNLVEHVWAPIFIAVEWLFMPGRSRLSWRVLWIAAVYPLAWVALSLVRGLAGDGWFPYFFLNVTDSGVPTVAIYVAGIAAFIITLTAAAIGVGRLHSRIFADLGIDRDRL